MIIHMLGMNYKGYRLNDLNMPCLLVPEIAENISRGFEKHASLICFSLSDQSRDNKH